MRRSGYPCRKVKPHPKPNTEREILKAKLRALKKEMKNESRLREDLEAKLSEAKGEPVPAGVIPTIAEEA